MELILQQNLPHQQKAIEAVSDAFDGVHITPPVQFYENPQINLSDVRFDVNLKKLQDANNIPFEFRTSTEVGPCLNLDIKMETGTGKTYVYTKTIYELHKRYGLNKFIIAVPSLAIKAGTAQFMQDEYSRRHFTDVCGYGSEIEIGVLEAPKNKKKGRSYFPGVVSDFIKGSCQNTNKIYVLLVNMQLITSNTKTGGRDTGLLWRDDYDYGVEGFYRPFDALRATKPVVIIDEPHRFRRDQKAFQTIMAEIQPQVIIRYGATFPEIKIGRGNKEVKDYQYLLYDLNACKSFNQGLIKGVAKEHFESPSGQKEKIKIKNIINRTSVTFQHKKDGEATHSYKLQPGDSLAIINNAFEGITITAVSGDTVEFSNGVIRKINQEIDVDVYMTSYQEQMIKLALQRHFETERENFSGRTFKIKTLALFFIDDISSYRPTEDGKTPYLLEAFEKLLKEQIEVVLAKLDEHEVEYRLFLEASLANISACHAGYFSRDNNDSDEEIAKEVDVILNGKKRLLSFKNSDGSYNTLRFLFSKWTLKEGWDNPNVFTIAKLRSSGSENSKLQEVGRGLRLPVDENGNRISNEEFRLNYIVDFTEANFAQNLVEQINAEVPQAIIITEGRIKEVASKLNIDAGVLFTELMSKNYIDWQRKIVFENRAAFFEEYPLFKSGLGVGKVKDRNKESLKPIKIRKNVYAEIRELWERINQRYLLFYDNDLDSKIEDVVLSILENGGVFSTVSIVSSRATIQSDGTQMSVVSEAGVEYSAERPIKYGDFLKKISRVTNIPIKTLHSSIAKYCDKHGTIDSIKINDKSAGTFCEKFREWKIENLQGRIHYVKNESLRRATALSYNDGTPKEEIAQWQIGTRIISGIPCAKYLYDAFAFDSDLEKENIMSDIEEVVVYGKIPRNSIAIPTITGEMYSPDFMYVVKKSSGEKELNVVIETKGVKGNSELRGIEKAKIECAKIFFNNLSKEGYVVKFHRQLNDKKMGQIINELLSEPAEQLGLLNSST